MNYVQSVVLPALLCGIMLTGPGMSQQKNSFPVKVMNVEDGAAAARAMPATPYKTLTAGIPPGDSVGYTYYDYLGNGSAPHNVCLYPYDYIAIGRMASLSDGNAAWNLRGSYYTLYDGTQWSVPWARVEPARKGWSEITSVRDGREILYSHTGNYVSVSQVPNYGIFSNYTDGSQYYFSKMTSAGDTLHAINCSGFGSSPNNCVKYTRIKVNNDNTVTVQKLDVELSGISVPPVADSTHFRSDAYSIAARGNKVAVVQSTFDDSYSKIIGKLYLFVSTDAGNTWTSQVIADTVNADQQRAYFDPYVVIDHQNKIHCFWSTYHHLANGDDVFDATAKIMHWSETSGSNDVVFAAELPVGDSVDISNNAQPIGYLGLPSCAVDNGNNLYMVFQGIHNNSDRDANGKSYYHVYACASDDQGITWGNPVDLGANLTGWDMTFPSTAKDLLLDQKIVVVYNCDPYTGNQVSGGQQIHPVAVRVMSVNKNMIPFGSGPSAPVIVSYEESVIDTNSCIIGAVINPNGDSTYAWVEYGTSDSYGSATGLQYIGQSAIGVPVEFNLQSLDPGTEYHYRIMALNHVDTMFTVDQVFVTAGARPGVILLPATDVYPASAKLAGTVNPNSLYTTAYFSWGADTSCANSADPVSIGPGTVYAMQHSLSGLIPDTRYFYEITASNSMGTERTETGSFTTAQEHSPHISYVKDVPNDQGGKIYMTWQASDLDTNLGDVTFYSVWRALPDEGGFDKNEITGLKDLTSDFSGKAYRRTDGREFVWEWLVNVPAHRWSQYAMTCLTLYDSSSRTEGKHYFLISAHTADPNLFYDSRPDSGYSLDNIAPVPLSRLAGNVSGNAVQLHWEASYDSDFSHYMIYRSRQSGANPDTLMPAGIVTDTVFEDTDALPSVSYYYFVTVADIHDNVSGKSNEILVQASVAAGEPAETNPRKLTLHQNYPNPFNPATSIRYEIPEAGHYKIRILNLLGQEVTLLTDRLHDKGMYQVMWNGRNRQNKPVGSGLYFYQLVSGNRSITKKMILMK